MGSGGAPRGSEAGGEQADGERDADGHGAGEDADAAAGSVTLQEAAEALGVHYMTAYRYVRLGLIHAEKAGGAWQVPRSEVDRLLAERQAPEGAVAPRPGGRGAAPAPWAARLEARLRAGDERGSWGVIEAALAAGSDPTAVYLELLVPSLRGIGDAWASGEVDISVEHRASVIVMRLMGRLGPRFNRRGQTRGTVVLGAPAGDLHGLPTAIMSDLVRGAGFTVADLGADTPTPAFVRAALDAERLVAVAVGVTTWKNEATIQELTWALHEALPGLTVLVGGGAVHDEETAQALGADGWAPDALAALVLLEEAWARAS